MANAAQTAQQTAPPDSAVAQRLIIEPSWVARNWWLFRRAFVAAYEDNCFGIAKGAAYSGLLSLFPILSLLTAILIQANAQSVVHVIERFAQNVLPPGTEDIVLSRLRDQSHRGFLPLIAIIGALWAGSGAMCSLMDGFQAAYRIPSGRPFLKQRAMAIFLLLIGAIPAVGASSLIIFGNRIEAMSLQWLGFSDLSLPLELAWKCARWLVAFLATTLVTGLLFYFGPNHRPEPQNADGGKQRSRFLRVWPGAVLATMLWLVATAGFAWYVGHLANYNLFYGSVGAVIVLLIWIYLIACVSLIGCEFNAERERINQLAIPD